MVAQDYNYDTFRRSMMHEHMGFPGGPEAGEEAPDVDLPTVGGEQFRLGEYRDRKPVLLLFGSVTCPMTAGARPALINLHQRYRDALEFVYVYVREAHPGERRPHHTSDEQKMEHARAWAEQDRIPVTVAVDDLEGTVHRAYGGLPNPAYLIDRTGHVAFRALWAGEGRLLRQKIDELLEREASGEDPVNLGQRKNMLVPLLRGAAEFDHAIGRGGEKAAQDFRREMGPVMYGFEKLMSRMRPLINPANRAIE